MLRPALSRQPAVSVLVNGVALGSVIEVEVERTLYLSADRCRLRLAGADVDPTWLGPNTSVEITFGVDGSWAPSWIGRLDQLAFDPVRRELTLVGRDLTSLFLRTQSNQGYENRTSSEIVAAIAATQGLQSVVTPTSVIVGRYFGDTRTRSPLLQNSSTANDWELMSWLADLEGYDLWLDGQTVYFQPGRGIGTPTNLSIHDCQSISAAWALELANGITVNVKSWNSAEQAMRSGVAAMGNGSAIFNIVRPNLSADDAQHLAQQALQRLSTHQQSVRIEIPGELTLAPGMVLTIGGLSGADSLPFRVAEIERRFSSSRGFQQSILARAMAWTGF